MLNGVQDAEVWLRHPLLDKTQSHIKWHTITSQAKKLFSTAHHHNRTADKVIPKVNLSSNSSTVKTKKMKAVSVCVLFL